MAQELLQCCSSSGPQPSVLLLMMSHVSSGASRAICTEVKVGVCIAGGRSVRFAASPDDSLYIVVQRAEFYAPPPSRGRRSFMIDPDGRIMPASPIASLASFGVSDQVNLFVAEDVVAFSIPNPTHQSQSGVAGEHGAPDAFDWQLFSHIFNSEVLDPSMEDISETIDSVLQETIQRGVEARTLRALQMSGSPAPSGRPMDSPSPHYSDLLFTYFKAAFIRRGLLPRFDMKRFRTFTSDYAHAPRWTLTTLPFKASLAAQRWANPALLDEHRAIVMQETAPSELFWLVCKPYRACSLPTTNYCDGCGLSLCRGCDDLAKACWVCIQDQVRCPSHCLTKQSWAAVAQFGFPFELTAVVTESARGAAASAASRTGCHLLTAFASVTPHALALQLCGDDTAQAEAIQPFIQAFMLDCWAFLIDVWPFS